MADKQNQAEVVTLNISKGQLASILGTIPETLSWVLAKLSAQGFDQRRGITLLDRGGPEDVAE